MEAFKTILMGCGALAILTMVGCVGLTGLGTYAVHQAAQPGGSQYDAFEAEESSTTRRSTRPARAEFGDDPFSDYENENDGWSDDAR